MPEVDMKFLHTILIACFISLTSGILIAQKDSEVPFTYVEKMPHFQGGSEALEKYIAQNLKNPSLVLPEENNFVILKFVVGTDGNISNIKVARSLAPDYDEAAVSVIESMSGKNLWEPGSHNGRKVPVILTWPVKFRSSGPPDLGQASDQGIVEYVEKMPEFPGGKDALAQFIATELEYPKGDCNRVYSKVVVQFTVDTLGILHSPDAKTIAGMNADTCDFGEKAVALIYLMNKRGLRWSPALLENKKVATRFTLPVIFDPN